MAAVTQISTQTAVVVAALNIASTKTTMFAEVAAEARFVPSRDPRRLGRLTRIECGHVLASAAIPLVFPARRIGSEYYCDGGIRFNTPLAPAIRSGADRLVVVSALHRAELEADTDPGERLRRTAAYPSPFFILGKVLNALLLDPINYDLSVMRRLNRLWGVLEETLTADEMHRVRAVLDETRGVSYRRLDTLVFHPSQDIGDITTRHAKRLGAKSLTGVFMALSARARAQFELCTSLSRLDRQRFSGHAGLADSRILPARWTPPRKLRKRRTASNCDVPRMRQCLPLSS